MTVGIVGLGLIGGSIAKAYARNKENEILVYDIDKSITSFSIISGTAGGELAGENLGRCDVLFIATYPQAAEEYLRNTASQISKDTLVIDCLGTKRRVCALGFKLAEEYGFTFVGGHPMAGTQNSGYKYSREDLFDGAPMVIVPPRGDDIQLFDRIKTAISPLGFGSISVTSAEEHDRVIAFSSQLAHVVSSAYIKSPTAGTHKGFSAGSYRDLTRVAALAPNMWTQLFVQNSDFLVEELDCIVKELQNYRNAIAKGDAQTLERLLKEGSDRKKEIDGA